MDRNKRWLILAVGALLIGCSDSGSNTVPENTQTGGIAFKLAKNTIPSEVGILEVRLERDGYTPRTSAVLIDNFIDTVRIAMEDIPVGVWQLTIDAKDSSGHLRYTGNTSVAIIENQTVQAFVQMESVGGGVGGVSIFVVWSSDRSPLRIRTAADTMYFANYIPIAAVNQLQTEVMLAACCMGPDWRLQENRGSGEWSPPGECMQLCPGISRTLTPGSAITDSVRIPKSGHYRVMLRYMILSPISSRRPAWQEAYSNEFWVVQAVR